MAGITCLYIASKVEEIYPPNINSFAYVCDNAYTKQNIIEMESKILHVAEFKLVINSGLQILNIYAEQLNLNEHEFWMARYFLDYSLLKYSLCGKKTSMSAAGAVLLTLYFSKYHPSAIDNFINSNNMDIEEVRFCSYLIWEAVQESKSSQQFTSVERKYSHSSVFSISDLPINVLHDYFPRSN